MTREELLEQRCDALELTIKELGLTLAAVVIAYGEETKPKKEHELKIPLNCIRKVPPTAELEGFKDDQTNEYIYIVRLP